MSQIIAALIIIVIILVVIAAIVAYLFIDLDFLKNLGLVQGGNFADPPGEVICGEGEMGDCDGVPCCYTGCILHTGDFDNACGEVAGDEFGASHPKAENIGVGCPHGSSRALCKKNFIDGVEAEEGEKRPERCIAWPAGDNSWLFHTGCQDDLGPAYVMSSASQSQCHWGQGKAVCGLAAKNLEWGRDGEVEDKGCQGIYRHYKMKCMDQGLQNSEGFNGPQHHPLCTKDTPVSSAYNVHSLELDRPSSRTWPQKYVGSGEGKVPNATIQTSDWATVMVKDSRCGSSGSGSSSSGKTWNLAQSHPKLCKSGHGDDGPRYFHARCEKPNGDRAENCNKSDVTVGKTFTVGKLPKPVTARVTNVKNVIRDAATGEWLEFEAMGVTGNKDICKNNYWE